MKLNRYEQSFKEVIEDAARWVSGDNELEIIHWGGAEDCEAGWYAYEYDGDQSFPIYANDYDKKPLISDNTVEQHNVRVVEVLNLCNVSYCG